MFNEYDIVQKVLGGDMRAFESLVKKYEQLVYYVASRMVNDQTDKEDICQEVFIKIYRHLGSFHFESKLATWIGKITYSTSINHLKKKKLYNEDVAEIENFQFTDETPDLILEKKDLKIYVNNLIEQLPVAYRSVITLYHLNEFSYQEIEEITGMPEGTVKNYLFRARKLLKEKIENNIKYEL